MSKFVGLSLGPLVFGRSTTPRPAGEHSPIYWVFWAIVAIGLFIALWWLIIPLGLLTLAVWLAYREWWRREDWDENRT
jgi:hypothetical protein